MIWHGADMILELNELSPHVLHSPPQSTTLTSWRSMFWLSSLIFQLTVMLFERSLPLEKKFPDVVDTPVTCTRICQPSMSVLDESRGGTVLSLKFLS